MKLHQRYFIGLILIAGLMLTTSSCVYEQIEPVKVEEVTWTNDILPIFVNRCSSINCHAAGDVSPDLSEANAYNNLVFLGFVDTSDPENSEIYKKITVGSMQNAGGITETEKAQILAWIRSGALED